jgi:transketolase N-terminal domain/subunit
MTEQEQAVAFLKQEWDKVVRSVRTNYRSLDSNLNSIKDYSVVRDSFMEVGYDVSEVQQYELDNPFR